VFAGEITFQPEGKLQAWSNKTGHYLVAKEFVEDRNKRLQHVAHQTKLLVDDQGQRLLPMDRFQEYVGGMPYGVSSDVPAWLKS
jgi:hypothetical protein